jgi:hypothetical protein
MQVVEYCVRMPVAHKLDEMVSTPQDKSDIALLVCSEQHSIEAGLTQKHG